MSQEVTYELIREGLQEILPDKFEIGYSHLDTVIEAAVANEVLHSKLDAETDGAANSIFDTLQILYEAAQFLLVCIKIWKELKPKPTEDDFLKLAKEKATREQKSAAGFIDLCKKIYAWLSRSMT